MYRIKPARIFLKQIEGLCPDAARILENKIRMLVLNPYRFKRLYDNVFRIRFTDRRKEKRMVYKLDGLDIKLVCILDRDKDYRDLRKYIEAQQE
jgi:hypothetical protein